MVFPSMPDRTVNEANDLTACLRVDKGLGFLPDPAADRLSLDFLPVVKSGVDNENSMG